MFCVSFGPVFFPFCGFYFVSPDWPISCVWWLVKEHFTFSFWIHFWTAVSGLCEQGQLPNRKLTLLASLHVTGRTLYFSLSSDTEEKDREREEMQSSVRNSPTRLILWHLVPQMSRRQQQQLSAKASVCLPAAFFPLIGILTLVFLCQQIRRISVSFCYHLWLLHLSRRLERRHCSLT